MNNRYQTPAGAVIELACNRLIHMYAPEGELVLLRFAAELQRKEWVDLHTEHLEDIGRFNDVVSRTADYLNDKLANADRLTPTDYDFIEFMRANDRYHDFNLSDKIKSLYEAEKRERAQGQKACKPSVEDASVHPSSERSAQ